MQNQQYPSVALEKAVNEFASLPGIGKKTALRLALHLLNHRRNAKTRKYTFEGVRGHCR
mgnify:CR=1 FL=1